MIVQRRRCSNCDRALRRDELACFVCIPPVGPVATAARPALVAPAVTWCGICGTKTKRRHRSEIDAARVSCDQCGNRNLIIEGGRETSDDHDDEAIARGAPGGRGAADHEAGSHPLPAVWDARALAHDADRRHGGRVSGMRPGEPRDRRVPMSDGPTAELKRRERLRLGDDLEPVDDGTALLTVAEFATAVRVSTWTVRAWCNQGRIRSVRLPGGRLMRIPASELERCRTVA